MIRSPLVWRMAWQNIAKQLRQTLLTLAAGSIGAMLITVSFLNYASVRQSGDDWIAAHLGPIDMVLEPAADNMDSFRTAELEDLLKLYLERGAPYRFLPVISRQLSVAASEQTEAGKPLLRNVQMLAFDETQARQFDPDYESDGILKDDEAYIDPQMADALGIEAGDAVWVTSADGAKRPFSVRGTPVASGLNGYLGPDGTSSGTIVVSLKAAEQLTGITKGSSALFVTNTIEQPSNVGMMKYEEQAPFKSTNVKFEAEQKLSGLDVTLMLSMVCGAAVLASFVLLRQILLMMGEARWELYGVWRAIGLSRAHIRSVFAAEALLISALGVCIGVGAGIGASFGIIRLFYGAHAEELMLLSGFRLPIEAHVPVVGIAALFAGILFFQGLVVLSAGRKAAKLNIVEALRGVPGSKRREGRKLRSLLAVAASLVMMALHVYQAWFWNTLPSGRSLLVVLLGWLAACLGAVYLALRLLSLASPMLANVMCKIRVPRVSVLLATKYPARHAGRTFTIALLFALIMMVVTFTVSLGSLIQTNSDPSRTNQTMLGYPGFAGYRTAEERDQILAAAKRNGTARELVTRMTVVEPYMLRLDAQWSQSFVPVTAELLQAGGLKLTERAPEFASDKAVWEAVRNGGDYIVLPASYRVGASESTFAAPAGRVKAGESITLRFFKGDALVAPDEKPLSQREFIVAGFAANNSDSKVQTDYLFQTTYVSPLVHEQLREYGYRWSNQHYHGFVLLGLKPKDAKEANALIEALADVGVTSVQIPYLKNAAEQLMNDQILRGFIGFTSFSALIGLIGLSVIQYRAVQERSREISMLRCVGLVRAQIGWLFLLEGAFIGVTGLLTGWLIGSSGTYGFMRILSADVRAGDEPVPIHYPADMLVPIMAILLLAAILINRGPAGKALRLAPAEAMRSVQN
ncbi:ABC transporter permease [Paenibacillus aurantiacus]|uniref:ABC transporter permease n=1 Tax=Paenibacillus aurantiacus TaxID=1936118 RepID=A0ABV5KT00_9BACL